MNLWPLKPHAAELGRDGSPTARARTSATEAPCAWNRQGSIVSMPRLGAHLSIAGGLPRAVDRAEASGCQALQIFTKSAGQWRARELPPEEIALFRRRVRQTGIRPVVAHNSYLINLAAADPALRARVDRGARRRARPRRSRSASTAWSCIPARSRPAPKSGGLRLIADGLAQILDVAARRRRRASCSNTPPDRARTSATGSSTWPRSSICSAARRASACASTPATCIAAGYDICSDEGYDGDVPAVREDRRLLAAEGVPPQRLEEAVRQPRRSPRAHRQGMPRPRAVPAPPQRSALREAADAAGDAEGGHAADAQGERRRPAGQDEPRRPARGCFSRRRRPRRSDRPSRRCARHPAAGRLRAGLREERLAVPAPLGRDLRQQQPAARSLFDDQAVAADHDRVGIARIDLLERPEDRDLDVEVVELGRRARASKRGSSRAALTATRATSSASGRRHSSVPMQPRSSPSLLQRDEGAAGLRAGPSRSSARRAGRVR